MIRPALVLLNSPSADNNARRLLGCHLRREVNGRILVGRIVETEAYDQDDPASHSFKGITKANGVMFGPPGYLYVYFTYGRHYCCNIVCGPDGWGAAVLIRALEPLEGEDVMRLNRHQSSELTNGPAKICQALLIDKKLNGHYLDESPLKLIIEPPIPKKDIIQTTRIGISRAKDIKWRYFIRDNAFVSKPAAVVG